LSKAPNQCGAAILFWAQIMSDHARFIKEALQPDNPNQLLIVVNMNNIWERLGHKLKNIAEVGPELGEEILGVALSFRELQRELLGAALRRLPITALPPTFYNHLLNELEELLLTLSEIRSSEDSVINHNVLRHHLVWVSDTAGHAALIGSKLDQAETMYREEAKAFENAFSKMYLKTVELAGYYRSDAAAVAPVLLRFNRQIMELLHEFLNYLAELKEGLDQLHILGTLSSLLVDHMIREENYYLQVINQEVNS
jgi:hypothetical protein